MNGAKKLQKNSISTMKQVNFVFFDISIDEIL